MSWTQGSATFEESLPAPSREDPLFPCFSFFCIISEWRSRQPCSGSVNQRFLHNSYWEEGDGINAKNRCWSRTIRLGYGRLIYDTIWRTSLCFKEKRVPRKVGCVVSCVQCHFIFFTGSKRSSGQVPSYSCWYSSWQLIFSVSKSHLFLKVYFTGATIL